MEKRRLGRTNLSIAPLVFGGNVFGWTADEKTSFALLDAFFDAGLNAIDTADVYSSWAPGNQGGESETIIGKWLKQSGHSRDKAVIVTKVGSELGPDRKGLSRRWVLQAVEDSLKRLQTDYIDLYLSHWPDPETPYEETLAAYDQLLSEGKVRAVGASNLNSLQLREALDVSANGGLPRYAVLQPEYNLYDRDSFDGPLRDLCVSEEIGVISYFGLARGFLSGKYRTHKDLEGSARGSGVEKYLDGRGMRILGVLDEIAEETGATQAEIALAWVRNRKGITAPIASATNLDQLTSLIRSTQLTLSDEAIRQLNDVSE
ncbi:MULTISPECIES: aldo/keto reductase [Ensifer]|jgi:aryl-alcohol dehydrogenase-like predicted oxidoreductase|uniref:Aldo/keto reductase n=1 Tax=Ensifer canadensis TaxID=555315 RepID=A0AAW4FCR5_9HYPH|nr:MULTISPECIES: aldo/keto reductase [Ensifer]AHK43085.1 putative aldo/keto reductase [Ensifer adhaerens OV14]MDP9628805.1 aryl-alcohol dehydrogenase-like predicted oxidoreductase [Ensifer adhaerens]KQU98419.1 alcohol dehydrogenase [Ensifer sp. Root31]KQW63178.1 alcohol dehydrogenase [Ensifer sp. Root1252]KQW85194.1 alcohol dehydrogenase [Ensifer sp. Root127]